MFIRYNVIHDCQNWYAFCFNYDSLWWATLLTLAKYMFCYLKIPKLTTNHFKIINSSCTSKVHVYGLSLQKNSFKNALCQVWVKLFIWTILNSFYPWMLWWQNMKSIQRDEQIANNRFKIFLGWGKLKTFVT